MAKAIDVAKFFIEIVANTPNEDAMTNLRLNKLLYFAQAGSISSLGYTLIEEDFEAWDLGPVVKSVYKTFKEYGRNGIVNQSFDRQALTKEEQLYLLDVLRKYSTMSTSSLVNKSHEKGTPWYEVYYSTGDKIIPKHRITEYYGHIEIVDKFTLPFTEKDFVGTKDKSNHLVLPQEYDYAE